MLGQTPLEMEFVYYERIWRLVSITMANWGKTIWETNSMLVPPLQNLVGHVPSLPVKFTPPKLILLAVADVASEHATSLRLRDIRSLL